MKINNPKSRFDLKIASSDLVLEIGGGHNPHPRADYVVDKYVHDNTHRSGDLKVLGEQFFVEADGESLPFKDKVFDYVICCHVLEHVPNPEKFLKEMMRVAKRGYIEVPSLIGEFLAPKSSHTWVSLEIENKLTLVKKSDLGMEKPTHDFGDLFLYHLTQNSIPFKMLKRNYPDLFSVRIEWDESFGFSINPTDEATLSYFTKPWTKEQIEQMFPKYNRLDETIESLKILTHLCWKYALRKLNEVQTAFMPSLDFFPNKSQKHQTNPFQV
ncbi:methyltransferase domain-containing protein [Flammeovirgaceae bacterium SG7u.111]|nr:methyltransferase domain-containing protein [Flammeovirgaceae bacterium SG7u.132]WPO34561.1 methyltransferase domain-containing protein [Flammeovirgaceae bacterium SG7u.111]